MEKRILALISLIMCLSIFLTPCTAYAASTADAVEPIKTSEDCSLTMKYDHDGVGFEDITISLYQIATVSSDYQYTLADGFSATNLSLNGISSTGEWNTIRTTLESYIAANNPMPYLALQTDENGQVCFTTLEPGLYLVASVQCSENGFRYYFASVLTAVPDLNEDGTWNYNVAVNSKPDIDNPTGEDLQYSVLKLWKDEKDNSRRPTIEVDILRNGETVETVFLSEENKWSYSWWAEDDGSSWSVIERNVPDGYKDGYDKKVDNRTTTFFIINSIPDAPENPDIPKTGDTVNVGLYIMLMCISGIALVILGITGKRKSE